MFRQVFLLSNLTRLTEIKLGIIPLRFLHHFQFDWYTLGKKSTEFIDGFLSSKSQRRAAFAPKDHSFFNWKFQGELTKLI